MATLPFPISAEDTDEYRYQVYELIRRIYEEKIGGADLGDVFDIPGDTFMMKLHSAGGLKKISNKLAIEIVPDAGLMITVDGLKIKVNATGGIQTTDDGTSVKLDGTSIQSSAYGLKLGQSSYIHDPFDGRVVDPELRTALIGILDLLIERGLMVDGFMTASDLLAASWAWFKVDEGTGLTINDSSQSGMGNGVWDTTWGDPTDKVWSVPGFGHNDTDPPQTNIIRTSPSQYLTSYVTALGFVRPLGVNPEIAWYVTAQRLGEGGQGNWVEYGWDETSPYRWQAQGGNSGGMQTASVSPTFGQWYFCAVRCAAGGRFKFDIRPLGGSLTNLIDVPATSLGGFQTVTCAFGINAISYVMDGGDFAYYASACPETFLTDAQLNLIYAQLASRYS